MEEERIIEKAKSKLDIIKEFYLENISVNDFCNKKGIKLRTFYRWLKDFNDKGYDGLIEKSKKPKHITETPIWAQNIILELNQKIGLGSKNISQTIGPLYKLSHTGILNILRRNGIIIEREKKRWKAFRAPYKNHTWQMDFLGPHTTNIGEISLLVVLDDYSRYCRSKIVKKYGTSRDVCNFLDQLIKDLGKPYRTLTDNGTQFRKMFDKWCKKQGIKHHKSRVRHPQTLGKTEAVNKTLGKHFTLDFNSLEEGQIRLNALIDWYNNIHFNQTIQTTPATAYGLQKDKLGVLKRLADEFNLTMLRNALK